MSKGDIVPANDEMLVQAMKHEYSLLAQSYKEFLYFLLQNKKSHDDQVKLYLYNSYAKLLHHLYEFLKSCVAREISKTKSEDNSVVKDYIVIELDKIARQRGEDYHANESFEEFAEDLRKYRNKVYGHVMKERFDQYPLGDFYSKYHAYIAWLVHSTEHWWSSEVSELASHNAVQQFSEQLTFGQREFSKNS
jgi:hypothetical protein